MKKLTTPENIQFFSTHTIQVAICTYTLMITTVACFYYIPFFCCSGDSDNEVPLYILHLPWYQLATGHIKLMPTSECRHLYKMRTIGWEIISKSLTSEHYIKQQLYVDSHHIHTVL